MILSSNRSCVRWNKHFFFFSSYYIKFLSCKLPWRPRPGEQKNRGNDIVLRMRHVRPRHEECLRSGYICLSWTPVILHPVNMDRPWTSKDVRNCYSKYRRDAQGRHHIHASLKAGIFQFSALRINKVKRWLWIFISFSLFAWEELGLAFGCGRRKKILIWKFTC